MYKVTCVKCDGKGVLPMYSHVENGICFSCQGNGDFLFDDYQLKRYRAKHPKINITLE